MWGQDLTVTLILGGAWAGGSNGGSHGGSHGGSWEAAAEMHRRNMSGSDGVAPGPGASFSNPHSTGEQTEGLAKATQLRKEAEPGLTVESLPSFTREKGYGCPCYRGDSGLGTSRHPATRICFPSPLWPPQSQPCSHLPKSSTQCPINSLVTVSSGSSSITCDAS